MTIKRYQSKLCRCLKPTEHHTHPLGVWVHYEDHEEKVKELEAKIDEYETRGTIERERRDRIEASLAEQSRKAIAEELEDLAIPIRGGDLNGNTRR